MKVEYRSLPRAGGKVSTIGIGAGGLHEATPQVIKDTSFRRTMMILRTYSSLGSSGSILGGLAVRGRDVKKRRMMYSDGCVK